jgi:hypothetical protein
MADITLKPSDWNIQASKYNVKAGDRLILQGDRAEIELHDLTGTPDKPIILTALSPVTIKGVNPGGRAVMFSNCKNVRITGDPAGNGDMNITITNTGQAVDFRDMSAGVEADHLTIMAGYSGINAKTDPTCDPKTWRGNFTLKGIRIHHNDITTTDGEGVYAGESHWNTVGSIQGGPCDSGATTAKEHEIEDVIIEYNIFRSTGADAIQVGSCPKGARINNNDIRSYGKKGAWGQTAGIICNPGTVGDIYDNVINTGTGFAIQLQGPGGSKVYNNLIINAGSGAIMAVNYLPNGKPDEIYNNTIVNAKGSALEYYSPVTFKNNLFQLASGAVAYKKGGSAGVLTESGNKQLSGISGVLDASYAPIAGAVPPGVGYKPLPTVVKEAGSVEVITTDGVSEYFIVTPSGKRKKLD